MNPLAPPQGDAPHNFVTWVVMYKTDFTYENTKWRKSAELTPHNHTLIRTINA
jgi:hypothetical protein